MKTKHYVPVFIGIIISGVLIFSSCEKEEEPVANFSASQTTITEGKSIQFSDESTKNPTSWDWDFGDGNTSSDQNPTHTYANPGTYTVELTVSNSAGSDTKTKLDYITVEQKKTIKKIDFNGTLYIYPEDNAFCEWGGRGTRITVGNQAKSDTNGEANISAIVSQLGSDGHAAYVCDTLTAYGYDDWYLPSRNELDAMYERRYDIGGFSYTTFYWSSTESYAKNAWGMDFFDGTKDVRLKDQRSRVRCVRRD